MLFKLKTFQETSNISIVDLTKKLENNFPFNLIINKNESQNLRLLTFKCIGNWKLRKGFIGEIEK